MARKKGQLAGTPIPEPPKATPIAAPPAAPSPPPADLPARRHPAWDRPLTPRQLARFLQVSPRTIARLAKARKLPKVQVGEQVRFIPNDVLDHLRRRKK